MLARYMPLSCVCMCACVHACVRELRDFKCAVQFDHSKFQPTDKKLSLKGGSRHVAHIKYLVPLRYLEWIKLETSNFVHWLAT